MSTTYVALLRAVNVGGRNPIKMPVLQALFEDLGYAEVATYIQSGNVVFATSAKSAAALTKAIEQAITREFGLDVGVLLRTKAELAKVVAGNPFVRAAADPSKLHVRFLETAPAAGVVRSLDEFSFPPDEFVVRGRDVYLHCPGGFGKSKLNGVFWDRHLKTPATTRNWNTVNRLLEMASD